MSCECVDLKCRPAETINNIQYIGFDCGDEPDGMAPIISHWRV